MKRIGAILIIFAVLAVALITINGPLVGKVFSTINSSLKSSDYYTYNVAQAPMPARDASGTTTESYRMAISGNEEQAPSDALQSQSNSTSPDKRMVIKNSDLTIVVKDPAAKMQAISDLADSMGGYIVSSSTSASYLSDGTKVPEGTMVMRVPQEKLNEALTKIKADVVEIQNETTSGQDVTKEYTDLSSQLKNLQATEKKLTEIMDKAEKTEDVLSVFNQLTDIRGKIEVIVGQMKYYEQSAAMSAISVRILAEKTIKPIEIAGWQPQGQARDAAQALVNFFQNFVNFLIWLVIFFIPILAVLLIFAALFWRLGTWIWRKIFPPQT